MAKKWVIKKAKTGAKELAGYDDLTKNLLINRGITTLAEADYFLRADFAEAIHDPFLMKGMTETVERIKEAITKKEKVIIFADYDADGVPGAAILESWFETVGHTNLVVYIPDRHSESYGLKEDHVTKFKNEGATLIITIDCGITAVGAAKKAKEEGIDLIITDHHLPPAILPEALAIVNPKLPGCAYPFKELCGSGVIYKVVCALSTQPEFPVPMGFTKWLLDLVAIATVSDMMPMIGENRILVKYGLIVLNKTKNLGLQNLIRVLKLKLGSIAEDDIGFLIGPRLNAASRMAHAFEAYELLTTHSEVTAHTIALSLEKNNQKRRKEVETILTDAFNQVDESNLSDVIVVGGPNYNLGVLGLASGRLAEKYDRLVFVWGQNGLGEIKGSCRSPHNVNVVELMKGCGDLFIDFGGHAKAGGFSLLEKDLDRLAPSLLASLAKLPEAEPEEIREADCLLSLSDVSWPNAKIITKLSPFGKDNPKPVFWFKNLMVKEVKTFGGGGAHLELKFEEGGRVIKAIGFFSCPPNYDDDEFDPVDGHNFADVHLASGRSVDLLANVEISTFGREPELRLRIVDVLPA